MASSDATPLPLKATAYRVTFPMRDNAGALIASAGGLDSEVSKDAGNFADCTAEATEIQSTGIYTLDLSASEMNADSVVIKTTCTNTNATTMVMVINPWESTDYNQNFVDPLLKRDMSAVTGESARSLLNAARKLMNKVAISGSTLTVYKEDDSTSAYTQAVSTDATAAPITALDTN